MAVGACLQAKGDRKSESLLGGFIFRSRVSAIGIQVRVIRFRFGFRKSAIDPVIHFGWQVAAPGGRWRDFSIQSSIQPSTQSSIQSSVIDSALCPLSSIQSSTHSRWPVAAPGGRWRGLSSDLCLPCPLVNLSTCQLVLPSGQLANRSTNQLIASSIQPSIQSSTQSSMQSSVIDSAQPEEARSARSADPTSRQCPEITKNQELRTA